MLFVTGCQRSGTKTYAEVLGIEHEVNFTPRILERPIDVCEATPSECSWLIAPFSNKLLENGHNIIRIIRHPFKVIRSLLGIDFWTGEGHKPYRDYIRQFMEFPVLFDEGRLNNIHMSLWYWVYWNKLIPEDTPTVRIEDLIKGPQLNSRNRCSELRSEQIPWTEESREMMEKWGYSIDV